MSTCSFSNVIWTCSRLSPSKTMNCESILCLPFFFWPNILSPGLLRTDSLGCPGQHHNQKAFNRLPPSLSCTSKGFLIAYLHISPSFPISNSNSVTCWSKAQSHFNICLYKLGEMHVNGKACTCVYKHGFSTWSVKSHSLMCISYTHAHIPYPVLTAVLWSRSRSDGAGEGKGDCGSS